VTNQHEHIDKPEPRWQALLAFLAVGAIYLALPLPDCRSDLVAADIDRVLTHPDTVISHRTERRSLNRAWASK